MRHLKLGLWHICNFHVGARSSRSQKQPFYTFSKRYLGFQAGTYNVSETVATSKQDPAHQQFRLCIPPFDGCHILFSLAGSKNIHALNEVFL